MANRWDGIPADVFVEILQRLPPCPRRRLRLVCRHWRSVIDDHTPGPQARAKLLVFIKGPDRPHAYVYDDLTEGGPGGRDLELPSGAAGWGASMVGTCNGLLCLHRHEDGDLVVVNPVTGEKLAVPPPPKTPGVYSVAEAHSFGYHPATGLYKIVHVPCNWAAAVTFDAVHVFTMGDGAAAWRVVPVRRGSSCLLRFGLVSVGGATYWVSSDAQSVVSFDLKDERLAPAATLPVRVRPLLDISWHPTADMVNGRLGFALCSHELKRTRTLKGSKTEVWILEDGGGRNEKGTTTPWVLRHTIVEPGQEQLQAIARPHFTHGEHILTTMASGGQWASLHATHLSEARTTHHRGAVRMKGTPPSIVGRYDECHPSRLRTFAYVETTEPLALYRCADDGDIGDDEDWNWKFDRWERRWKLRVLRSKSWLLGAIHES